MSIHSFSSLSSSLDSLGDPHLADRYPSDNEKSESNRATKRARCGSYNASENERIQFATSQVAQEALHTQGMGVFTFPSLNKPDELGRSSYTFMKAASKDRIGCFRGSTSLTPSFDDKALANSKPFFRSLESAVASESQEFSSKAASDPFLDEPDNLEGVFEIISQKEGSSFELSSSPKELPLDFESSRKDELEPTVFGFIPSKSRKNLLDSTIRSPVFVGDRLSADLHQAEETPLQVFQKTITPFRTSRLGLSLSDGLSSEDEDSESEEFGGELGLEIDHSRAMARQTAAESLVPKRSRSGDSFEVSMEDIESRLKSTVLSRVQERSDSRGASSRPEHMFASLRSDSVPIPFTSIAETEETERRAASVPLNEGKSSPFISLSRK